MSPEDIAQQVELRQWEFNNRSRASAVRFTPADAGYGPEYCITDSCEAPMPDKRREWGFGTCIAYQTLTEQKAKHIRR